MPKYGLYDCDDEVYDLIQTAKWWHEAREIGQDWDFLNSINKNGLIELSYIRLNAIQKIIAKQRKVRDIIKTLAILHRVTTALIEMEGE